MIAVVLVLVAVAATTVALCLDPLRQIVLNGVYGLLLVILFVVLQAPDVALSMLVVGSIAYPFVILIATARAARQIELGQIEALPGERPR